jgi:hypothetical protein
MIIKSCENSSLKDISILSDDNIIENYAYNLFTVLTIYSFCLFIKISPLEF